jgi:hypothetical protein
MVLGGIPSPTAAALVARYLLLGPSEGRSNQLRLTDPDAVRIFTTEVEAAADDAAHGTRHDGVGGAGGEPGDDAWVGEAVALLSRIGEAVIARLLDRGPEAAAFAKWVGERVTEFADDPYDPFLLVVDAAIAATGRLYAPVGLTAGDLRSRVAAVLRWRRRPPSPTRFAGGVRAATQATSRGVIRVVVEACPMAFGRHCALVLPYVLLHEHICHAARFAVGGPPPTSTRTLFTEGWMDYVAAGVHDAVVGGSAGAIRPWLTRHGHQDSAGRLQEALRTTDDGDHVGNGRQVGWTGARLLDDDFGDRTAAWRPLWDLSARLNASPIPDDDLDRFAAAVHGLLTPPRDDATVARLYAILHDRGRTPRQVVEETCELAERS